MSDIRQKAMINPVEDVVLACEKAKSESAAPAIFKVPCRALPIPEICECECKLKPSRSGDAKPHPSAIRKP